MKDKVSLIASLLCMLLLLSCSALKQSTKSKVLDQEALERTVDGRSLVLKTALKETNTLTYHPDGSIYQFQRVNEEVAQKQMAEVEVREKASVKKEILEQERIPMKNWGYIAVGLVLLAVITFIFLRHERN